MRMLLVKYCSLIHELVSYGNHSLEIFACAFSVLACLCVLGPPSSVIVRAIWNMRVQVFRSSPEKEKVYPRGCALRHHTMITEGLMYQPSS